MENGDIRLNTEALTFGEVLKKAREEKQLTIDDIVMETRISKQVVEQIESKDSGSLPEPVFLRGFLKSYAEQVDLDPVNIVDMYKVEHGIVDRPVCDVIEPAGTSVYIRKKSSKTPVIVILFIVFIVALFVFSFTGKKTDVKDDPLLKSGSETSQEDKADAPEVLAKDFKLEIECVEETSLKISADGEKVKEYKMKPEDHLELKATKEFNILIDNTCGVTLFMNGKLVEIPGKCGQTINVHLP